MIVFKEMGGILYAADIAASKTAQIPGDILKAWTPIGPGTAPVITYDEQGCYVTFNYLDHVYTRRLDTSIWPPQVIDPVTTGPTSIQEPHDAIGLQHHSAFMDARPIVAYLGGTCRLKRTRTMYYDPTTDEYMTSVVRDDWQAPFPLPATRKKWRVYIRNLGETDWILLQDWIPEIPEIILTRTGSMKLQLMCTYGHLWTEEGRNTEPDVSGLYLESMPGVILTINSDLEGKTRTSPPEDQVSYGAGTPVGMIPDPKMLYGAGAGDDAMVFGAGDPMAVWIYPGKSSPFLVETPEDAIPYRGGASGTALLYS